MPEIGDTLRETRMRRRIDISEVETETKIRAKYLRALENEEWDLLPGPTYVKTFLRTYAEYLGVDPKLLVEEYKQRYERPATVELTPFANLGGRRDRRRGPRVGPGARVALSVLVGVVALVAALFVLGSWGDGDGGDDTPVAPETTVRDSETQTTEEQSGGAEQRRRRRAQRRAAAARIARLRIVPTGTVNVCLIDAGGKVLIRSENLTGGDATRTFRSRRFRVTFGNGEARMRVNGKTFDVPDRSGPVGFEVTASRRRELPVSRLPTCGA